MEHHDATTISMTNDDERVALLLHSGNSKRSNNGIFRKRMTATPASSMKAVSIACFVCFCAFASVAFVSRDYPLMKTYLENRLIVQTLGVSSHDVASSSSCEDIVERETQAMTFYVTDLFGWSPFVETRLDASYKRRSLKYSLSRSAASAAESSEPSEKEEEEEGEGEEGGEKTEGDENKDSETKVKATAEDKEPDFLTLERSPLNKENLEELTLMAMQRTISNLCSDVQDLRREIGDLNTSVRKISATR